MFSLQCLNSFYLRDCYGLLLKCPPKVMWTFGPSCWYYWLVVETLGGEAKLKEIGHWGYVPEGSLSQLNNVVLWLSVTLRNGSTSFSREKIVFISCRNCFSMADICSENVEYFLNGLVLQDGTQEHPVPLFLIYLYLLIML